MFNIEIMRKYEELSNKRALGENIMKEINLKSLKIAKEEYNEYAGGTILLFKMTDELRCFFEKDYKVEVKNGYYMFLTKYVDEYICMGKQDYLDCMES